MIPPPASDTDALLGYLLSYYIMYPVRDRESERDGACGTPVHGVPAPPHSHQVPKAQRSTYVGLTEGSQGKGGGESGGREEAGTETKKKAQRFHSIPSHGMP